MRALKSPKYAATRAKTRNVSRKPMSVRGAARLALGVFQRRLASSAWALLRSFERRIEKLAHHAADLQAGKATLDDLAGGNRRFECRGDYFDEHGADDDYREGVVGEAHEDFEAEVLGAVVVATVEDLQAEVEMLTGLRGMARKVLDDGNEAKFVKLREVLEDGAQGAHEAQEKWLVFTEVSRHPGSRRQLPTEECPIQAGLPSDGRQRTLAYFVTVLARHGDHPALPADHAFEMTMAPFVRSRAKPFDSRTATTCLTFTTA